MAGESIGRGSVWLCDRCGFFGLYKPESEHEAYDRTCPGCGNVVYYHKTGDIALVAIEGS